MRPITSEERGRLWNRLNQTLSFEGRLYTTISVMDELEQLDIDPASLDHELIEEVVGGLTYINNIFLLIMQTNNTQFKHLISLPAPILHSTACSALGSFDHWLKRNNHTNGQPQASDHLGPQNKANHDQENKNTSDSHASYLPEHEYEQPRSSHVNTPPKITKDTLKNILHGNHEHAGYHTQSWFYYFFGCIFGLNNRRSGTIVVLFELLNQQKEQFEEMDIKQAIISPQNHDPYARRRLGLFEGNGNKNGSSTDDIIEELRTAFRK